MAAHWTLEDLYRGVMRSWWVLVGVIVLCVAGGLGVFLTYTQTYTASAQHTVEPISVLSSGSSFNTVNMETERVIATSTAVLERASEELGGVAITSLRNATVIQVPRNSQVLIFEVTTRDPDRSAEWANALANAYGADRTANARTVVEQATTELTGSIEQLQALMDSQPEGSSARAATQQQLQALLDQRARLTATPFFSGILITPATPPLESNRPSIFVFVAAGIFLGFLLGGVAALIVSRVRQGTPHGARRKSSSRDAERPAEDGAAAAGEVSDGGRHTYRDVSRYKKTHRPAPKAADDSVVSQSARSGS